jgi:hypothetical protein
MYYVLAKIYLNVNFIPYFQFLSEKNSKNDYPHEIKIPIQIIQKV